MYHVGDKVVTLNRGRLVDNVNQKYVGIKGVVKSLSSSWGTVGVTLDEKQVDNRRNNYYMTGYLELRSDEIRKMY